MIKEAAYLKLYDELKEQIINGRIKKGEKLPSKRQLASDFGVSVITAEHALSLLSDEGYIEAKERSGYYVLYTEGILFDVVNEISADKIDEIQNNVYVNNINNIDEFRISSYIKAIRKTVSEYGYEILIKSPNNGCERLRKAISSYLFSYRGIKVLPQQIVVGAGAEYLYGLLVILLGRDRIYGIEKPSYEKIEKVYRANQIRILELKLGNNGIHSSELWNKNFNVLHVSPYRSFPSGVSASASKRREYIRWLNEDENRVIIEDDFESEFYPQAKPAETLFSIANSYGEAMESNVIYVNTFSKTISPSIRTGYMVLPEKLIKDYEERAGFYSCAVPTFEQYVIAELIENGDFVKNINRIRRKNRI